MNYRCGTIRRMLAPPVNMKTLKPGSLLVYLLPFLHLCACLIIAFARLESGWGYMVLVDIPMSVIILAISYSFDHPLLLFGTLGTLWWYLLSRAAQMIGTRVFAAIRNSRFAQK